MAKSIQVRDVPDDVHHRLVVRAAEERVSLSELALRALRETAAHPTTSEMLARLEHRPVVRVPESAADAVRSGRDR
jgi:plasmid stability protein